MSDCDLRKNFLGRKEIDENGKEISTIVKNPYCGQMTKTATKRLVDTTELFLSGVKYRWVTNKYTGKKVKHQYAFCTLTVPMNRYRINGSEGYDLLLEPFLFWLIKTKKVNTYIWKAELQQPIDINGRWKESGGQIHWHIMFPNWIDKYEIRNKWNYLLRINGFSDDYFNTHGHYNCPSTSIEKPYKSQNVADYILKEITKNIESTSKIKKLQDEKERAIINGTRQGCITLLEFEIDMLTRIVKCQSINLGGKVWGCSNNLKRKSVINKGEEEDLDDIDYRMDVYKQEIKQMNLEQKQFEHKKKMYEFQIENDTHNEELYHITEQELLHYDSNISWLSWYKSQFKWLKKERSKFYTRQKNYFEFDMTDWMFRAINTTYNIYEDRGDWKVGKNTIWSNEYVVIYKFPQGYKDILLDRKHKVIVDGKTKDVFYKDEYSRFIRQRIGEIYTEKTRWNKINLN